jgi:hypothetical protein
MADVDVAIEDGVVMLGSLGTDMDAETEVVGESKYRDTLLRMIDNALPKDVNLDSGRVSSIFELTADEYRLRVTCGLATVGYVEDVAAKVWLPRVRAWEADGATTIMCSGVIVWDPRLGDPRAVDSVPVGVRLDLVDQS